MFIIKALRGFFVWNSFFWEVGVDRIFSKFRQRKSGKLKVICNLNCFNKNFSGGNIFGDEKC